MKNIKDSAGVTLVELMIVIVLVALLGSIAVPAYQNHVDRAKRSEAKAALLDTANRMEKFLYDNGNYAGATLGGLNVATIVAPGNYTLTLNPAPTTTTYTVVATPAGSHTDAQCGSLSLDQAGAQGATGPSGAATCWR